MTTLAYLGLGANLGDARQTIKDAVICLAQQPEITVVAKSCLYRSAPVDAAGPDYINAVIAVQTRLSARQLLGACLLVESQFGRERPARNAPRTLDIDLLLYGDAQINEPELVVPHPRMHERAFVLLPLSTLAPDCVIPGVGAVSARLARPEIAAQPISIVANGCQRCPSSAAPQDNEANSATH